MKTYKYHLIYICYITFLFSCAPSAENATRGQDAGNSIFIGFWHGIILPFSIFGKIIGFNIGILDRGRISDFTYLVGYGYALYIYFSLLRPLVLEIWSTLKEKFTKEIS